MYSLCATLLNKPIFHSRSNTISDDELAVALKVNQKDKKHKNSTHNITNKNIKKTPNLNEYNDNEIIASNSDTYDDDIDTETEDYCSSNENHSNNVSLQRGIKLFDTNISGIVTENSNKKVREKNTKKPPKLSKCRSDTVSAFLGLPKGINESDEDNYDSQLSHSINNLTLPKLSANKMHMRSYSESNIQRSIQKNQWPSSPSSDDSFDLESVDSNNLYSKFVTMKKKYKKQRRISRQFQDAITVIQDDNEDSIIRTEEQIRDKFEIEYEMKMIELEHQKLNTAITIEDKMKHILSKNDELLLQNKLLQQQVAAQVAMIQEQQNMAFEQQRHFARMTSNDSPSTPVSSMNSPMLFQFPSTHSAILRRVSSASTINTPILPPTNVSNVSGINAATNTNLSLNTRSLGLTPHSSMNSNNTFDEALYTLNDDIHSINTENSMINIGDISNKYCAVNMEPNHNKYANHKKRKHKKRKMKEIEQRLLNTDSEAKEFVGSGQTPWDRFVNLMTPSFCTCSPHIPIKTID